MGATHDHDKPTVKKTLTSKHPTRVVENSDYIKFARRVIRGLAKRVAQGDVEALPDMVALGHELKTMTTQSITQLRTAHGYSWAEIADRLGTSRQAAQQRWGNEHHPRKD